MNISFVASPLMKYAFFASLDEINGIYIPKNEYPLYIAIWNQHIMKILIAEVLEGEVSSSIFSTIKNKSALIMQMYICIHSCYQE